MTCVNGGFLNSPRSYAYAWLRNGTAIAGATAASYTLTDATSAGRSPAGCSATNTAGTADATSEALYVSAPAAAPFAATPAPTATAAAPAATTKAAGLKFKAAASWRRAASRSPARCRPAPRPSSQRHGPAGRRKTASVEPQGQGQGQADAALEQALKKGQKVVLKITSGKTTKVITAKAS